mgnify:CR=1 FL=1
MNNDFYSLLDDIENFQEISNHNIYEHIPLDWFIIATDVKGSTKAIEAGKYKEVNMIGALTIISILNLDKKIELPFVFGGDGAFLLIPSSLVEASKQALLAVQKISLESYGLNLRIGIIPVKDIYESQKKILIAKFKVSKDYSQAVIKGGGLEYCDLLLKDSTIYIIKEHIQDDFNVDIEGLECRWEAIPSPKDETLSLLIKCKEEAYYKKVLNVLDDILGNNAKRHPIVQDNLNLSFDSQKLDVEASIYSVNKIIKLFIKFKLKVINLLGYFLMFFKIGQWGTYKNRIISTTDTEKFDDMLRMVVSTNFTQTKKLEEYLEKQFQNKNLTYGIHKSDSALMTCLVFERHGRHIHFVDSSNGGYAMAAKSLKKRSI